MPLGSIPSPATNGLHVGPLFVHAYGLMYAIGVLAAIYLTIALWKRRDGDGELVFDVALWGFPAGLVGGRLYFLATSWNEVPEHWWGPLAIWQGGLGIWGGIAAGTLIGIWRLRRAGVDVAAFMDCAAPGLLVAQAIGRVGNYFNQELFGGPTSLPWGLRIDAAHRPDGYGAFTTFHPTFLYELLFDLALAAVLVVLVRRARVRAPGVFALYVAGYSGFRIFEETLRVDPAHHLLGLRLNFFVATALCVAGLLWFAWTQRSQIPRRAARGGALLAAGWAACSLGACGDHTTAAHSDRTPAPAAQGAIATNDDAEALAVLQPGDRAVVLAGGQAAHHRVGVGLFHAEVGRARRVGRAERVAVERVVGRSAGLSRDGLGQRGVDRALREDGRDMLALDDSAELGQIAG
jgi:prolipoprotein diacylglyceryl transferase